MKTIRKIVRWCTRWAWEPDFLKPTREMSVHYRKEALRLSAVCDRYYEALHLIGYRNTKLPSQVARVALKAKKIKD